MKKDVKTFAIGFTLLSILTLTACGANNEKKTQASSSSKTEQKSSTNNKKQINERKKEALQKASIKKATEKKASEKLAAESKAVESKKVAESAAKQQSTSQAAKQLTAKPSQTTQNSPQNQQNNSTTNAVSSNQGQTNPPQNNNHQTPAAPQPAESKVLGVPYISQGATMLCEGSSLLEALHYKGVTNQGIMSFVNTMPKSPNNNPYNGYAGEWRHNVDGTYQGMMAGPVAQWAARVGGRATQISGPSAIKNSIRNGNPVVAWIVYGFESPQFKQMPWGRAVWNGHVICVDGFRAGGYHIVDPNAGTYWVPSSAFESSNGVTGMALSIG